MSKRPVPKKRASKPRIIPQEDQEPFTVMKSVEDALPEWGIYVLTLARGEYRLAYLEEDGKRWSHDCPKCAEDPLLQHVTHWAWLPDEPEAEDASKGESR